MIFYATGPRSEWFFSLELQMFAFVTILENIVIGILETPGKQCDLCLYQYLSSQVLICVHNEIKKEMYSFVK